MRGILRKRRFLYINLPDIHMWPHGSARNRELLGDPKVPDPAQSINEDVGDPIGEGLGSLIRALEEALTPE